MQATTSRLNRSHPKLAWELAEYVPPQGEWSESDYIALESALETGRFIELANASLDFLPMPTLLHQRITQYLYGVLYDFCKKGRVGEVFFSGTKTRLWEGTIRLPDVGLVLTKNKHRCNDDYFFGADLVMEVVSKSPKDRRRDLVTKKNEYAKAGIKEYWIVDSELKQIKVLTLNSGKNYKVHGEFKKEQKASSVLLKGFEVDVSEALAGLKQ